METWQALPIEMQLGGVQPLTCNGQLDLVWLIDTFAAQALCINDSVQQLGNVARMNERCLELQKPQPKKRSSSGDPKQVCPLQLRISQVTCMFISWSQLVAL